ncbi:MAG: LacI family DNA-binding transcriptional regulator [Planctomycetota bacterium]
MSDTPTTLEELAALAGVSKATVSNALNGRGRMADATRARIRQLADEVGYRPNLTLASLAAKRFKPLGRGELGRVAVLMRSRSATSRDPRFGSPFTDQGFAVEMVDTLQHDDAGALSWELYQQGVQAVVIHRCLEDPAYFQDFDFRPFAVLSLDQRFSHQFPGYYLMRISRVQLVFELWRRMRERGHRRIGAVMYQDPEPRPGNERMLAALARCQERTPRLERVPPLLFSSLVPQDLAGLSDGLPRWAAQYRPDALLLFGPVLLPFATPTGLPYALLSGAVGDRSGYGPGAVEMGEQAVGVLLDMIRSGKRGVPTHGLELIVTPAWNEGRSL